ncbi:hypothetical protein SCLCIDRAFT_1129482 [Scleroderma citrinum Foug A]|uniref:Uncharacterized protein n=1 Tax=Scleroderma citrinum Foug A TaxID=1036808 RepID=A0A0C3DN42_9AGAM|nr:hypothetical protein SCLCIDRAFT_1129482 [Scleroderma citrinum Foug A]
MKTPMIILIIYGVTNKRSEDVKVCSCLTNTQFYLSSPSRDYHRTSTRTADVERSHQHSSRTSLHSTFEHITGYSANKDHLGQMIAKDHAGKKGAMPLTHLASRRIGHVTSLCK